MATAYDYDEFDDPLDGYEAEEWEDDETLFQSLDSSVQLPVEWHGKQREFKADPSNARVNIGGRRSGKSTVMIGEAIEVADMFPGTVVPYLSQTVGRAKLVVLPHVAEFIREGSKLHVDNGNDQIRTPNHGIVQLGGLSTKAEVEKGRGISSPALYIDEAGTIGDSRLRPSVMETYGPATKDFYGKGGRGIAIGGTPDYVPKSFWERLCGGNSRKSEFGYTVHHMTIWDNPFYKGREQMVIDAYLKENALRLSDPEVQREWFGRFCLNTKGLAYPSWAATGAHILPLVQMPLWGYTVLGVDLGSDHPCAFVVIRFTVHESIIGPPGKEQLHRVHHAHVLESYEESGMSVHDVRAVIYQLQKNYNVALTVGDSGGGGAMTIDTINKVMGVPIQPVVKAGLKEDRIWMLESMIRTRTFHVYDRCETLIEQLGSVPKERKSNGKIDHMSGYPDHSLDATHYALVAARQHEVQIDLPPLPGTKEWNERQSRMDEMIATETPKQRMQRLKRQRMRKAARRN